MAVRKDEKSGKWLAEAYVKGKRVRRLFATKADANRFFNTLKLENSPLSQFVAIKREKRLRLSEAAQLWYDLHGRNLITGEKRFNQMLNIAQAIDDPFIDTLTVEHFADYRQKRLAGELRFKKNVIPTLSSIKEDIVKISSLFYELKRLGKINIDNPLKDFRHFKTKETEIYFLSKKEIGRLLEVTRAMNSDLHLIVKLCLSTGARWSEVQNLKHTQLTPYKLIFVKTKNGKNRTVPISETLFAEIPQKTGRIFSDQYNAFSTAIKKAGIPLPKQQATHVLRHTFASHFMMNGGNILVLKDILGHSDITMTMRYAHFSPSHLEDAIRLNPLKSE